MQEFSANIRAYVRDVLNRDTINITPGIAFEKKSMNHSSVARQRRGAASLISQLRQFTNDHVLTVNLARASTETGRLFFFKGKQKKRNKKSSQYCITIQFLSREKCNF